MKTNVFIQEFEEFIRNEQESDERIATGKTLLAEIRSEGRNITNSLEREKYAQMARTLSDVIYDLSGELLPARLEAPNADSPIDSMFSDEDGWKKVLRLFSLLSVGISYLVIFILLFRYGFSSSTNPIKTTLLGVPIEVWLWGAIGGAVSGIYRVSAVEKSVSNSKGYINWFWVGTRPLIGSVLAALIYIVIFGSGFLQNSFLEKYIDVQNNPIIWVLFYLIGFSDQIWSKLDEIAKSIFTSDEAKKKKAE